MAGHKFALEWGEASESVLASAIVVGAFASLDGSEGEFVVPHPAWLAI